MADGDNGFHAVEGCLQRKTGSERFWLMILYWSDFCVLFSTFDCWEGSCLKIPEKGDSREREEGFIQVTVFPRLVGGWCSPWSAPWRLYLEAESNWKSAQWEPEFDIGYPTKLGILTLGGEMWGSLKLAGYVSQISPFSEGRVSKNQTNKTQGVWLSGQNPRGAPRHRHRHTQAQIPTIPYTHTCSLLLSVYLGFWVKCIFLP